MARAILRQRRQITLPRKVCEQLGIEVGDALELSVENGALIITPSKQLALDALQEIQAAFARSGLSEEDLQRASRKARTELVRERYGRKQPA